MLSSPLYLICAASPALLCRSGAPLAHFLLLVQFEMGPPMSTYLLAVTIGRLEGVTQQSSSGMNVTMWAVPGLEGQLGVALQVRFLAYAGGLA